MTLISTLTPVVTPALADEYEIEQAGATFKITGTQIRALMAASLAPSTADYWVETANADLSAEVVVGSTGITTAAYGSRQAAAKAGRVFLPSDGFVIERDTGAAWVPWGPLFPLIAPVSGDFAWVNQGGASIDTTNGGVYLLAPAGAGTSLRIRKKAVPSIPYTITALFLPLILNVASAGYGLLWRASGSGALHALVLQTNGTTCQVFSAKYTNETTFSASYAPTPVNVLGNGPLWMRISEDNTNRTVLLSADGQHFVQIHQVGRTDFLTADEIGFFANSNHATWLAGTTLLSWKQT